MQYTHNAHEDILCQQGQICKVLVFIDYTSTRLVRNKFAYIGYTARQIIAAASYIVVHAAVGHECASVTVEYSGMGLLATGLHAGSPRPVSASLLKSPLIMRCKMPLVSDLEPVHQSLL